MKNWVIITLSVIIVLLGGAICGVLVLTKPSASQKQRSILLPVVDVITVSSADYTVKIDSQGEVLPSRRTSLAAEVAGRVVRVSPKLEVGERFAADEILLEIDRADYESAEVLAASELAVAELALEQEQARSAQAKRDWDALGGGRKASDLVLRKTCSMHNEICWIFTHHNFSDRHNLSFGRSLGLVIKLFSKYTGKRVSTFNSNRKRKTYRLVI